MRHEFVKAVMAHQPAFGLELSGGVIDSLADYYDLVLEHNPVLHLVGPCSAEEFAIRHILESLVLQTHLPENAAFADVGAGAGLPSIPCLIARPDLRAVLIETKIKKSKFLEHAVTDLGIADRARVVNKQFQEADLSEVEFVTCRALDRFAERLPRLLAWSKNKGLLLYGGPALREGLLKAKCRFTERLLPLSEQRYLFSTSR